MAQPPRKPSLLDKLWRRPPEPEPAPPSTLNAAAEPEDTKGRDWKPPAFVPWDGPGHVASAFYTGAAPGKSRQGAASRKPRQRAQARQRPGAAFAARSGSRQAQEEAAFNLRFKGEVARAEARDAMEDARAIREHLQAQFLKDVKDHHAELRYYTSGSKPCPPELGLHLNQRAVALQDRFDRDMDEVDRELNIALGYAESLDLAEDRRRVKLLTHQPLKQLGHTPRPARDFGRAVKQPVPDLITMPGSRYTLDHPFNEAATRPATARPSIVESFNDAATAPDPLSEWFQRFAQNAPAPDPNRPPLAPSR